MPTPPYGAQINLVPAFLQGNVRLDNMRIVGQPNCLKAVIEPTGTYLCNTTTISAQDQFEAAEMWVTFVAQAAPRWVPCCRPQHSRLALPVIAFSLLQPTCLLLVGSAHHHSEPHKIPAHCCVDKDMGDDSPIAAMCAAQSSLQAADSVLMLIIEPQHQR